MMDFIVAIFLGILITSVGALPFGLVNLAVLDISFRSGLREAMKVARGAAIVEIIYGVIALLFGTLISYYTKNNTGVKFLTLMVPGIAGLYFLFKKNKNINKPVISDPGFIKGILLNLVSIQVFLYWLIAIPLINTFMDISFSFPELIAFALGIWLGKMGILWIYGYFSPRILSKSEFLTGNINRIIGSVILLSVLFQFFK
jgi:threonine/homoserine/homoserine lactone efflux protein